MSASATSPSDTAGISRPLLIAGIAGASAVLLGAFGAHGLGSVIPAEVLSERAAWWGTAADYHLAHALALGLCGVAQYLGASKGAKIATGLFCFGVFVFSGSLYVLALTGIRWLGAITPIGGLSLIGGWLALALSTVRRN